MFTTYAVYYISALGLTPVQLLLVGTALELTCLVFEGITGVVADTYSRKWSVIIGMLILGLAYVLEGSIPWLGEWLPAMISFFVMVVIAEIIHGIGWTFLSGADQAWIADEIGEEQIGTLFLKARQFSLLAQCIGIGLSVGLMQISPGLPYIVGGVLFLALGLVLIRMMQEHGFQPAPRTGTNAFQDMAVTWKNGVRAIRTKPVLISIVVITFLMGAASEGYDRLWEAHLIQEIGFPDWGGLSTASWFGILSFAGLLLGMLTIRYVRRKLDMENERVVTTSLFVLMSLRIMGIVSVALAPHFAWAVASVLALTVIGTLMGPMYDTWLNRNVDGKVRATVLSMMSQSDALGQTAGAPVVGWVGSRFSIRTSLITAAVLLSPLLVILGRVARTRPGRAEELE